MEILRGGEYDQPRVRKSWVCSDSLVGAAVGVSVAAAPPPRHPVPPRTHETKEREQTFAVGEVLGIQYVARRARRCAPAVSRARRGKNTRAQALTCEQRGDGELAQATGAPAQHGAIAQVRNQVDDACGQRRIAVPCALVPLPLDLGRQRR